MALVTPSTRSIATAARRQERARVPAPVPSRQRLDAPAGHIGEGTLREYVRMELLVARARAHRG
jgi:hypothetical protein